MAYQDIIRKADNVEYEHIHSFGCAETGISYRRKTSRLDDCNLDQKLLHHVLRMASILAVPGNFFSLHMPLSAFPFFSGLWL